MDKLNREYSIMDSVGGSNVQVVFEFPMNDYQKSLYIYVPDMITVSHSVSRAKIPVTPLGNTTVQGFGLGSKMVAGSIVKLFTRNDKINKYIKSFVDARYEVLKKEGKENSFSYRMSNIPLKEVTEYMRDDIAPFNIHLITLSEYVAADMYKPKIESIYGVTIINSGKVFSIENLITEETLSFMAKSVKYHNDIEKSEESIPKERHLTGSELLFYNNRGNK